MFNLSVVLFTIPIVKDIGISDIDIALIYTVLPFTVFIAPPLVGFLADRLGIYSACAIKVDGMGVSMRRKLKSSYWANNMLNDFFKA